MAQSFTFRRDPALAARAGRISMGAMSSAELEEHQTKAANALLQQRGIGYYAAMGRKSAAARAKRREASSG